jgi:hypothetical protein
MRQLIFENPPMWSPEILTQIEMLREEIEVKVVRVGPSQQNKYPLSPKSPRLSQSGHPECMHVLMEGNLNLHHHPHHL